MIRTYTIFWLVLLALAVSNGVVREVTYGQSLSELHAHQLSTVMRITLTGIVVWTFARYFPIQSRTVALLIGGIWVSLTVAFEFVFGHYVAGHSWEKLLFDYNLVAGRMWLVFRLWILMLPYIVFRVRGRAA